MEREENKVLTLSFDLNTLDHLGVKLYARIPPMIGELVSNAWDADAHNVNITFNDEEEKEIIISDDGSGMTFDELNSCYLKVGRNRRSDTGKDKTPNGRLVLGKKGLGKLSCFGIGKLITITTIKNGIKNQFTMDYDEIKKHDMEGKYEPIINIYNQHSDEVSGTQIVIQRISRSSCFDAQNIAVDLSKRFRVFSKDFEVKIKHNNTKEIIVTNDLYYEKNSEFTFEFMKDYADKIDKDLIEFAINNNITGKIYTSATPLPEYKRGIILFARGKLIQENNTFNPRGNDNFFSYMSGYFNVDFIDENKEIDYASTDRKSIAWDSYDNEDLLKLKLLLEKVVNKTQLEWRDKRAKNRQDKIKDLGVDVDVWLKSLNPMEKDIGIKITNAIIKNHDIDISDAKDYITHIQDMFSYQSFKEYAVKLDNLKLLDNESAIKLLNDWHTIESKELAKIAEGRIKTIEQFERYVRENASERDVIQKFLKEFPWLLDPKMSSFETEVYYSKLLKEKFPDEKLKESNRRIDFLCTNHSGIVHIIELKRPNIIISCDEILQATDYQSFVAEKFRDDVTKVITYLISDNYRMDRTSESVAESLAKDGKVFLKSYSDLLAQAKRYHKEFIQRYEEIQENI